MRRNTKRDRATAKTVLKSILSGDILILLRVDKLLPYILFAFVLGWVNILLNYKIEQLMVQVENNKTILEDYRIYHAQKTYQFVKMGRISTVEDMLDKGGSELSAPIKPAETIIVD